MAAKKQKMEDPPPARIAVIGAAWWSQGWHLPQLLRNPDAELTAIMQRSEQPTAAAFLNLTLETKTQLAERYAGVPIFRWVGGWRALVVLLFTHLILLPT